MQHKRAPKPDSDVDLTRQLTLNIYIIHANIQTANHTHIPKYRPMPKPRPSLS